MKKKFLMMTGAFIAGGAAVTGLRHYLNEKEKERLASWDEDYEEEDEIDDFGFDEDLDWEDDDIISEETVKSAFIILMKQVYFSQFGRAVDESGEAEIEKRLNPYFNRIYQNVIRGMRYVNDAVVRVESEKIDLGHPLADQPMCKIMILDVYGTRTNGKLEANITEELWLQKDGSFVRIFRIQLFEDGKEKEIHVYGVPLYDGYDLNMTSEYVYKKIMDFAKEGCK